MKNKSLLFLFLLIPLLTNAGVSREFLNALARVESSNNPKAYNPGENAIGIYQIRKAYFIDAQRIDKSLIKYNHQDCFNPEIAERVVNAYLSRYCKSNSFEDMARCHNSGPNWKNKKDLTNKYWKKIQKELAK